MAILKKYDSTQKKSKLEGKIASGWESGDSKAEMLVVEPLIQHPEIAGLYRAVDPTTGWKGWVEYTPPVVVPPTPPAPTPPTPEELARAEYGQKYAKLVQFQKGINLGIVEVTNPEYVALKDELKTKFKPEYLDIING